MHFFNLIGFLFWQNITIRFLRVKKKYFRVFSIWVNIWTTFSQHMCFCCRGGSGAIVVLLSSFWHRLSPLHVSFGQELGRLIALIKPVTGLNNVINPKSSKNFSGDFSMACLQQMRIFGIFTDCIGTFVYHNLYKRKLIVITRKKYTLHFIMRPL